jgi:hypothetical protein
MRTFEIHSWKTSPFGFLKKSQAFRARVPAQNRERKKIKLENPPRMILFARKKTGGRTSR